MLTLDCLVADCKEQVVDKHEAMAVVRLEAHRMVHKTTSRGATAARPRITQGMSAESWRSFQVMWRLFKTDTEVSEEECGLQLIQCCEGNLLERLFRTDHRIFSKTEEEQMDSIGKLVVTPHVKVKKHRQKATCKGEQRANRRSLEDAKSPKSTYSMNEINAMLSELKSGESIGHPANSADDTLEDEAEAMESPEDEVEPDIESKAKEAEVGPESDGADEAEVTEDGGTGVVGKGTGAMNAKERNGHVKEYIETEDSATILSKECGLIFLHQESVWSGVEKCSNMPEVPGCRQVPPQPCREDSGTSTLPSPTMPACRTSTSSCCSKEPAGIGTVQPDTTWNSPQVLWRQH